MWGGPGPGIPPPNRSAPPNRSGPAHIGSHPSPTRALPGSLPLTRMSSDLRFCEVRVPFLTPLRQVLVVHFSFLTSTFAELAHLRPTSVSASALDLGQCRTPQPFRAVGQSCSGGRVAQLQHGHLGRSAAMAPQASPFAASRPFRLPPDSSPWPPPSAPQKASQRDSPAWRGTGACTCPP